MIAAGLLAVLGQFSEQLGDRFFDEVDVVGWVTTCPLATLIPLVVRVFLVAFLVLGAVFSVLGYLITNWGFTLSRDCPRPLLPRTPRAAHHAPRPASSASACAVSRSSSRSDCGSSARPGWRAIVTGVSGKRVAAAPSWCRRRPRAVIDATGAAVLDVTEPLHVPLRQHGPAARRRRYTRALLGAIGAAGRRRRARR